MEIGKLPEKEFRIMIVKMTQDLRSRIEKMQEMFIKDLEELKKKQTEMNVFLEKINRKINVAEEIDSRVTEARNGQIIWNTEWWK